MKTTVSTPKVPSTPEPSKRNPAYKTITVTNSAGQCFTASAGSLVANLSVLSKKLKQDGPILAPFKFWRGDAEDFVKTYKNKQPLSERRVISAAYDRDNGEWVERYPNVAYDSEGEPVNGGHSVAGALASQENVWTIWCVLGVDPAMRPRIDVLNARGVAQQGYYVPEMYHGMEDANGNIRTDDVYSFVAASKYVMQYLCKYTGYVQGESPSVTKDKLMQIPEGIALMRAAKEHFIVLRAKLAKTGATSLMKAKFYVPALVLCLTEDPKFKKWAYALATGVGLEEDDLLLQCRNYIQEKCGLGHAQYRDSRVVKDVIEDIFAFLYAKATVSPYVPPFAKKRFITKGARAGSWESIARTPKQAKNDAQYRRRIVEFFLERIKLA